MRNFPTDPMAQHGLFMAAFCDDLIDLCANRKPGNDTPRADRIAEIARQTNKFHGTAAGWNPPSPGQIMGDEG